MAYPRTFNHRQFEMLTSGKARMEYCRQRLEFLGVGSARAVYKIDDKRALKIAKTLKSKDGKPSRGVAQNEVEATPYMQNYDLFAKVFKYHPKYYWVEMELARPATRLDFDRILGWRNAFDGFVVPYIKLVRSRYDGVKYGSSIDKDTKNFLEAFEDKDEFEDSLLWDIQFFMDDTQITATGDMIRLCSWGVVKRYRKDHLVMIDFGYNDYVRDKYYRR